MKYTYNAIFLKIPTFIKDALYVFCQMLNPYSWLSTFSISACWCHWYWSSKHIIVLFTCVCKKDNKLTDVNFVINIFEEEKDRYVFKRIQHKCQLCHKNSHDTHHTFPCCWNEYNTLAILISFHTNHYILYLCVSTHHGYQLFWNRRCVTFRIITINCDINANGEEWWSVSCSQSCISLTRFAFHPHKLSWIRHPLDLRWSLYIQLNTCLWISGTF